MASSLRPDGTAFDLPRLLTKQIQRELDTQPNPRFLKVLQQTYYSNSPKGWPAPFLSEQKCSTEVPQ